MVTMMFDTSWYATNTSVWTHTERGETLIADCTNKNVPLANQRINARLCAVSPTLMELLDSIPYLEPDHFNALVNLRKYVYEGKGS
jgi:hypothetical protein